MKTSENEKWMRERGLMTHDRPTHKHSHKRKRLLRASDENHFPTEIQIFMLSIRSSWNYYRPITSLFLSLFLSRDENVSKSEFVLDETRSRKKEKKKNLIFYILYTFCKQFQNNLQSCYYRNWKLCLMKLYQQ